MKDLVSNKSLILGIKWSSSVLGIVRGNFYTKHTMDIRDKKLIKEIEGVVKTTKNYGIQRISIHLDKSENQVRRVVNKYSIQLDTRKKRKIPFKPEDINYPPVKVPNYIRNITPLTWGVVWSSDFTYIPYTCKGSVSVGNGNGSGSNSVDKRTGLGDRSRGTSGTKSRGTTKFIYLATVIDVYSRQVVGYAVSLNHDTNLIKQALITALMGIEKPEHIPLFLHSDQGSEYRSKEYSNLVEQNGIQISYSHKGSPWQNGHQESFYRGFKEDMGNTKDISDKGQICAMIIDQINYYNNNRIHTRLKTAPNRFKLSKEANVFRPKEVMPEKKKDNKIKENYERNREAILNSVEKVCI